MEILDHQLTGQPSLWPEQGARPAKKEIGKVTNLNTLLALPLDIHDLQHFLPLDGVVRRDADPLMCPSALQEKGISENHTISSPETSWTSFQPEAHIWECLIVAVLLIGMAWRQAALKRRIKEAANNKSLTSAVTLTKKRPSSPPLKTIDPTQREVSPIRSTSSHAGSTQEPSSSSKVEQASALVESERIHNLVAQNKCLQTALDEQRGTIQQILQRLESRDAHLVKVEADQERNLKDITGRVATLSHELRQEQVERVKQACEAPEWRDVLGKRLDALTEVVKGRDRVSSEKQRMVEEELSGQVQALQDQVIALEENQKQRPEHDTTKEALTKFAGELSLVKRDLGARGQQMAKLGQYLKARDEKEDVKMESLQSGMESLVSKLDSVAEKTQSQQVQVSTIQRTIETKDEALTSCFSNLQEQALARDVKRQEAYQSMQAQCALLRQQVESLTVEQQKTKAASMKNQTRTLECTKEVEGLKQKCLSQDGQSLTLSASLDDLAVEVRSNTAGHKQLTQSSRVFAKEVASRLDALVQDVERHDKEHQEQQEAFSRQLCEAINEHKSSRARQDAQLLQFREEYERRLAESLSFIKALEQELRRLKGGEERVSKVEERQVALDKKMETLVEEFQERLDLEVATRQADYDSRLTQIKSAFKALEAEQQSQDDAMKEWRNESSTKHQRLAAQIANCTGDLQSSIVSVSSRLLDLKAQVSAQEEDISKVTKGQGTLNSKLLVMQGSELVNKEAQEQLETQVEALESKLDGLERDLGDAKGTSEEQGTQLSRQIERLSGKIDNHHEVYLGHQKETEDEASELRSALQQVSSKLKVQMTVQQEEVDRLGGRWEDLENRLDKLQTKVALVECEQANAPRVVMSGVANDLPSQVDVDKAGMDLADDHDDSVVSEKSAQVDSGRGSIRVGEDDQDDHQSSLVSIVNEAEETIADSAEDEVEQVAADCAASKADELPAQPVADSDVDQADVDSAAAEAHETEAQDVAPSEGAAMRRNSSALSAKLAAFTVELERRKQSVAGLELHAKVRSDEFSSRAEVLNHQIEMHRHQLKKWEDTTHKNEARLSEKCAELHQISTERERLQDELLATSEDIADLEDTLEDDDGMLSGSKSHLECQLREHDERRQDLKKRLEELEACASTCETECSNLSAKQHLFEDELGRRERRVSGLRSSLSSMLELVAVERESLQQELQLKRQERDHWKEKTQDLCARLHSMEGEQTGAVSIDLDLSRSSLGAREQSPAGQANNEGEATAKSCLATTAGDTGEDDAPHIATDVEQPDELSRKKEALKVELEKSKEHRVLLAEKMDRITADREKAERLEVKLVTLQCKLENNQSQLGRFSEEQSELKSDLNARVDELRDDIRTLEELQQKYNSSNPSHSFEMLTEKLESLATEFATVGVTVAKAGALADSIRRCESQLQRFETEQDGTRAHMSSMIEVFKSDLSALKQSFEENLNYKDKEFSRLLARVEKLVDTSQAHEKRLGIIEDKLEKSVENSQSQIQPEHLLQQMNEKYIDLAVKVDLLASELQASGERDKMVEQKVKDRDELYLSQMDTVRRELEAQQARYQDVMQVKVYDTMLNVFKVLAKRQGLPSAFAVWNSSEESLALSQRSSSSSNGSQGNRDEDGNRALVQRKRTNRQGSGQVGYSMASGIIQDNLFLPVIMSAAPAAFGKSDSSNSRGNDSQV